MGTPEEDCGLTKPQLPLLLCVDLAKDHLEVPALSPSPWLASRLLLWSISHKVSCFLSGGRGAQPDSNKTLKLWLYCFCQLFLLPPLEGRQESNDEDKSFKRSYRLGKTYGRVTRSINHTVLELKKNLVKEKTLPEQLWQLLKHSLLQHFQLLGANCLNKQPTPLSEGSDSRR